VKPISNIRPHVPLQFGHQFISLPFVGMSTHEQVIVGGSGEITEILYDFRPFDDLSSPYRGS